MNHVNAALAGITAAGIVLALALGRSPPPVVAAEPERSTFELSWLDAAVPLALKAEALRPRFVQAVEPVKTEPAIVAALPEPVETKPVVKRKRQHYVARNVCQRHGMKKVKTGRYGWRCRR